jgi:FMN phosphatase YigB (HAD superfamily)
MDIKVVSIDFWDTLYFHKGSPMYREEVRTRELKNCLESLGFENSNNLAETFFETVDKYVKGCWARGICPTEIDTIRHADEHYQGSVPKPILQSLLKTVYETYVGELRPELAHGGREVIEWLSARRPLYLISDTFTLVGSVLDRILMKDGLFSMFTGRFYSDQIGKQKPDSTVIRQIEALEGVSPNQILHIGDLLKTDGELARNSGCRCIIVNRASQDEEDPTTASSKQSSLRYCRDLEQVEVVLSGII